MSSISGKLTGWDQGSNKNVIFLGANEIWNSDKVYSTSQIDVDGNFRLNDLDTPNETMFMNPVYPRFSDDALIISNSLTCSDSSAKQVWGYLVITLANDTSLSNIGRIYRRNFKKGWNKEVTLVKSQEVSIDSGYTNIVTSRSISNNEPLGGRWDFNYYGD